MSQGLVSFYKSLAPPFPLGFAGSVFVMSMEDSVGVKDCYRALYCVIKNGVGEWYFFEEDRARVVRGVARAILENPSVVKWCREKYKRSAKRAVQLLNRDAVRKSVRTKTGAELAEMLREGAAAYRQAIYYVEPYMSFEVGGHDVVRREIGRYLTKREIVLNDLALGEYYSSLVNFTQMSYVQEAEISLLNISLLGENKRRAAIKEHERNFYWQYYDYYGPVVDAAAIEKELRPLLMLSREVILKRIRGIKRSAREKKLALEKNLARHPLSKGLVAGLAAIRELGYWYADDKKRMISQANVGIGELVKCLAEQRGIDDWLLHFATFEEIVGLLDGTGGVREGALRQRSEDGVLICRTPERYFEFLTGEEAAGVLSMIGNLGEGKPAQLRGRVANGGRYVGPARVVIDASQIAKVKKGDVLVAPMTTVNFVPAMKKAGAIITDIGGITSHAAIVSRELSIPCVVGTKVATQVLKDEDEIEVDADKGVVTIVRRAGE